MGGVAEIKTLERMTAAEVHGIGSRGHRHGLQRFVRLEVSGLAGKHASNIFIHRHSCSNLQPSTRCRNLDREVSANGRTDRGNNLEYAAYPQLAAGGLFVLNLDLSA